MSKQQKVTETKICRLCGEPKPLDLFEKDSRSKGGRTNRCKSCKQASNNVAYKAFCRFKERYPDVPIETTKEEVAQIFEAFEGRCAYCNVKESDETGTFHLEHIRPLSREGGRHHVSNLVISCRRCNARKNNKPLAIFFRDYLPFSYDSLRFIVGYIAYFSGRTTEEVEQELIRDADQWESGRMEKART